MRKKLIDKDALAREIENLKSNLIYGACASQIAMETRCKEEAYNEVLSYLDTLGIKEVDLEKEIKKYIKDNICGYIVPGTEETAKYFFELGLKTQKRE